MTRTEETEREEKQGFHFASRISHFAFRTFAFLFPGKTCDIPDILGTFFFPHQESRNLCMYVCMYVGIQSDPKCPLGPDRRRRGRRPGGGGGDLVGWLLVSKLSFHWFRWFRWFRWFCWFFSLVLVSLVD